MLFSKKQKFHIKNVQIKEELKSKDENVMVKINIQYPEINCDRNDPLAKNAQGLYPKLAQKLLEFGKNQFLKKALDSYNGSQSEFSPYAVVMRWENTYIDKNYLSVFVDVSISDGDKATATERKTQIWDRSNGQLCRFSHFFKGEDEKKLVSKCAKRISKGVFCAS